MWDFLFEPGQLEHTGVTISGLDVSVIKVAMAMSS